MRMRKLAICGLAALMTWAAADVAVASNATYPGEIVGVQGSKMTLKAKVGGPSGELKKVTKISFKGVPVSCSEGTNATIPADFRDMGVRNRRFSRTVDLQSGAELSGTARVSGKFSGDNLRAKGKLSLSANATDGTSCSTGQLRWQTSGY